MSNESIKKQLHSYIDNINNEAALLLLQEAAEAYCKKDNDIIDMLNPRQKKRLEESVQQFQQGKISSNAEVSKLAKQWLTK